MAANEEFLSARATTERLVSGIPDETITTEELRDLTRKTAYKTTLTGDVRNMIVAYALSDAETFIYLMEKYLEGEDGMAEDLVVSLVKIIGRAGGKSIYQTEADEFYSQTREPF
jgi:hypothetical protein